MANGSITGQKVVTVRMSVDQKEALDAMVGNSDKSQNQFCLDKIFAADVEANGDEFNIKKPDSSLH